MVVLLVIILVIWVYMFMEDYSPGANSRFYRRSSSTAATKTPTLVTPQTNMTAEAAASR
jgi:hypothetical protein